jgi:pimeloyl-ACP methyl ester carboxylesterase
VSFAKTDRGQFFYEEYGSIGPVLYLLHGLSAQSRDWWGIPDILAKIGFHVFVFDMRGHGQSDKPQEGYSPVDHALDIDACARTLNHTRVHLVGHSTGGRNALVFAGLFPDKTWSLTIIDQTLKADPESWKKYQKRYAEYPVPFADEEAVEKFLKKKFKNDAQRYHYYKGQLGKREDGKWDWNFLPRAAFETQKLGREKDAYDLLGKVKCQTLFIKGGNSDYVSLEEAEMIRKLLPPDSHLVVVSKAEHAVFRDNPEGFLKALVPFLFRRSQGNLFVPEDKEGA